MKSKVLTAIAVMILISALLAIGCQENESAKTSENMQQSDQITPRDQDRKTAQTPVRQIPQTETTKVDTTSDAGNTNGPKLLVTKGVVDFGEIAPDKYYEGDFTFKNTGSETLKLTRAIQSTCGCSVPKIEKMEYAPGESGTINVRFHSPKMPNKVSKKLYMFTNDPDNKKHELVVQGEVVLTVQAQPDHLNLAMHKENAGLEPITITSKDGKPFSILKAESSQDGVEIEFDPEKKAQTITVYPKANTDVLKDQKRGYINFTLSHPDTNTINISYTVVPMFEVNRPMIIVQNAYPQKAVNETVWIVSNYGDKFEIDQIQSDEGLIEVVEQKEVGNRVKLELKITPPQKTENSRNFRDNLKIHLKNGTELEIKSYGWYSREA